MRELLVVVDMQTDFVDGALGTKEAQNIVENVVSKVKFAKKCGKDIIFTMDTHQENYLETQEGKKLPVAHCIKGSKGWEIIPELQELTKDCMMVESLLLGVRNWHILQPEDSMKELSWLDCAQTFV